MAAPRQLIALLGVAGVVLLAAAGALAVVYLGPDRVASPSVAPSTPTPAGTDELTPLWVSETERNISGNHHAAIGARVDGRSLVFAPVSGEAHRHAGHHGGSGTPSTGRAHAHTSGGCALLALNGTTGSVRWSDAVPPANCTIHSVADPTVADADGDGSTEVLATSTLRAVAAYDPLTGDVEFRRNLSAYGYTRPVVADLVADPAPEVVVVDVRGSVFVFSSNGRTVWRRDLSAYAWGQPEVADFEADGEPELAVGLGTGELYLLEADGSTAWNRSVAEGSGVTWMTAGQVDDDPARELLAATPGGHVVAFDGASGAPEWRRDLGAYAAVRAVGDADGDGVTEVYATARDGKLRALAGPNGSVQWTTALTAADVQMTPPPILADVDGDGDDELVAATNDGRVLVVDPDDGAVLAGYRRPEPIYTHPTAADLDGDGGSEVVVTYGDGRVAVLSYAGGG
ncbi:hypothetical protein BRC93_06745 [Halobacteriales archaeon QS_5_70_15]|nr:MAG: hypothetical protein BRC93_06745 [Halobacteriales archaeon QS_5_70_15]